MKSIGLLGSTGSIGMQTLQVIDTFPGEYGIKYLTANKNVKLLAEQALKYNPGTVCIVQENFSEELEVLLKIFQEINSTRVVLRPQLKMCQKKI
jgi:1-deoxy-D-xylulose-5-phosphate reductoisomerase